MVFLENDLLKIQINLEGGCLHSIYDKARNTELLYQPDGRGWLGQDVVIFPFIARLKNGSYTVNGNEYEMKNHGIVRYSKMSIKEAKPTEAILYLDSSDETLAQYPYKFHFEVKYVLDENTLSVRYKIVNTDDKPIYYEFGGHPAIQVDGHNTEHDFVIENTILEISADTETDRYFLEDSGSYITSKSKVMVPSELVINKKLIEDAKTFIIDARNINECILKTRGYRFFFDIKEAQVLALWTSPGFGDFLCVEPWWGIPDILNPNTELKLKPMIHSLKPEESEEKGYSVSISLE
ncbi:MAG: hypothetical protein K6A63_03015 [Acholeplasmatales bacterium]|nr:hypothetical protein [Acholeplasmatales bacterium]